MSEIWSGDRHISLQELNQRAARAASGFESLGVGFGDTVAVYLRNDFPFFEASFGAGLLGAYPVPVNWHYTEDEARYLFENSGAKVIVIHADLLEPVRSALPHGVPVLVVPTPPEIQRAYNVPDEACRVPEGMTNWEEWVPGFAAKPPTQIQPPGTIIYTSGTTGRPKGVRRHPPTPEQVQVMTRLLLEIFGFAAYADDPSQVVLAVTGPMYHSAPNAYGLYAARFGANVILEPRFDAEELLRLIEERRITHLHMVPIMFNRLLKLPEEVRNRYDLSSLKFVVHAAAPVAPAIKRQMIEWWGPVIYEYYGSTETLAVVFCDSEEWLAHPGTVGKPLPGADIRILDAEGRELPQGEIGEVVSKVHSAPDFTYHGDDEKRRQAEKAGLISPGDVG